MTLCHLWQWIGASGWCRQIDIHNQRHKWQSSIFSWSSLSSQSHCGFQMKITSSVFLLWWHRLSLCYDMDCTNLSKLLKHFADSAPTGLMMTLFQSLLAELGHKSGHFVVLRLPLRDKSIGVDAGGSVPPAALHHQHPQWYRFRSLPAFTQSSSSPPPLLPCCHPAELIFSNTFTNLCTEMIINNWEENNYNSRIPVGWLKINKNHSKQREQQQQSVTQTTL